VIHCHLRLADSCHGLRNELTHSWIQASLLHRHNQTVLRTDRFSPDGAPAASSFPPLFRYRRAAPRRCGDVARLRITHEMKNTNCAPLPFLRTPIDAGYVPERLQLEVQPSNAEPRAILLWGNC
jgi:hypothetical protein